ncbi:hypothetical protein B0181_07325 [Moraxella caviae]|uniref:Uncharacterized protein n=1 Tax=Moraxella caviae TaxID=34060 RepID=A0A1T0A1X1_9GAMM|nr:hypothetical protein B0181_07325 [Moraxella caviae]
MSKNRSFDLRQSLLFTKFSNPTNKIQQVKFINAQFTKSKHSTYTSTDGLTCICGRILAN